MEDKKLIYVCSKYKGDVEQNTRNALAYCRAIYRMGYIPIASHLHFTRFLDDNDPVEREDGLKMGLQLLNLCNEIWVFGDDISSGMQREIDFAIDNSIPIKHVKGEK